MSGTVPVLWLRPLNSTGDWIEIKQPSAIQYVREDYDSDDSYRTMSGDLIRDKIATKIKLECEWPYMTLAEISQILKIIDATFFEVKYYDLYEGKLTTKVMYAGNKSAPFYNVLKDKKTGKDVIGIESFSVNFIEK